MTTITGNDTATTHALCRVVFDHFIETGKEATVKDLVARTGLTAATVRKHIWDTHGISHTQAAIDVTERNYNTVTHQRLIDAWEPSLAKLRYEIQRLRGQEVTR